MTINARDILRVTKAVTKEWEQQRKAEERGSRSRRDRQSLYTGRVSHADVAHDILPDAYAHASGGGKYWVKKRQLYYAARKRFQAETGRDITAEYFSQKLLRKYLNTNPQARDWKIAADARGHLLIPNAAHEISIPIGTLEIDAHLRDAAQEHHHGDVSPQISCEWPSVAARERYQAVLYIEKEGFGPLLQEARLAGRYDLAILSGKGQSTEAARRFVDETCGVGRSVPLLVLRDFDKSGFIIKERLTSVADWAEEQDMVLYEFQNEIDAIDLGLRLQDVQACDLFWAAEQAPCSRRRRCKCFRCQPLDQTEYGITDEECRFLASGRRVELNALSSPQFLELLETKLTGLGLHQRLVPTDEVLTEAWRRALIVASLNTALDAARDEALARDGDAELPADLRQRLVTSLQAQPEPWDRALYRLAESKVSSRAEG